MRTRLRSLLALLVVTVPVSGAAQAPAGISPPNKGTVQASADVTVVEVPVYVAGRDGKPVRGLTKADFELYDEGKLADGWDLEVIDLEDFGRQTTAADMPLPLAAQRHYLFLFDLTFSQTLNIAKARHAAVAFVENGMKNGDLGAVATVDVEKGLRLVLSFTPDRDQLAAALTTLALPTLTSPVSDPLALTIFDPTTSPGIVGGATARTGAVTGNDAEWADTLAAFVSMQEKSFDSYQQGRVRGLSKSLSDLARTLNSVRGRKNVIYFSEGFDSKLLSGITGSAAGRTEGDQIVFGEMWRVDSENRYGRNDIRIALDEMFQIFKRTDCVLHAVDVAGLAKQGSASVEGVLSSDFGGNSQLASRGRGRDSLYTMSSETGGQFFQNSNDMREHLETLQQETSLVYLLSYSPAVLTEPGRYHNLKVKVKASGAQVSFRAGYYEPRPWSKLTPIEKRLLAAQQIAYGLPRNDIPARAIVMPLLSPDHGRARTPVVVEIPGDTLLKQAVGDKLNLEIYAYATDQALKTKGFLSQSISLDLNRVGPQLAASGIKFYGELSLPPGTYWLKILLRISETGRSGLLIVPVTVPPPENRQLFALGPLFHEPPGRWVMVKAVPRPNAPPAAPYPFISKGDSFIPGAEPVLNPSAETTLSVFVYNAPPGADLDIRGEIRGKAGLRLGPATLTKTASVRTGADERLDLLCAFRPEKLGKGSYTLWIAVRDPATGAEGETLGFFEVP